MPEFLAQAGAVDLWTPIIQGGVGAVLLGPIIYWMSNIIQVHLEKSRQASLLATQASMVTVLSLRHLDNALQEMAQKVKQDTEDALKDK